MVRAGAQALGLKLFAPTCPAAAVTAVLAPPGVDSSAMVKEFRERFAMVVANGQGEMKGKLFPHRSSRLLRLSRRHRRDRRTGACAAESRAITQIRTGRRRARRARSFCRAICRGGYGMKIVVADKISPSASAIFGEHRRTGRWFRPTKRRSPRELADADAILVRSATFVDAAMMDKAPKLRVIGRAGVGVDNVDLDAATKRGIVVMNTPGGNAVAVAEHTFGTHAVAGAALGARPHHHARRQVGKENAARHRASRQDSRHRRPGPGGSRSLPPCARLRHEGRRPRPLRRAQPCAAVERHAGSARRGLTPSPTTSRCTSASPRRPRA